MSYIGERGIKALQSYHYRGEDRSILAKYFFQPFWSRFVFIFPLWFAPNLITLSGFVLVILSTVLSYLYSPSLTEQAPRWVYGAHALLLFLYQTFDSVDGKQARRTQSSSPLGELFDHGCDALTTTLEALNIAMTMQLGRHMLLPWLVGTSTFYLATWETFHTHTLILPVVNGPDEGLLLTYIGHGLTAILGPGWWLQTSREALGRLWLPSPPSPLAELPFNMLVLLCMVLGAVLPTVIANWWTVQGVLHKEGRGMGRAVVMLLPYGALAAATTLWGALSPSRLLETQPFLLMLALCPIFGLMVGRIILAHLTGEEDNLLLHLWQPLLLFPLALGNALSAHFRGGVPLVPETLIMLAQVVFAGALHIHFVLAVIQEICAALGIQALRVVKRKDK